MTVKSMLPKTDQLLIRACKTKNPLLRLRNIYKRFYSSDTKNITRKLIVLLSRIVYDYFNIITMDIILELDPNNLKYKLLGAVEYNYYDIVLSLLINHIRFIDNTDLTQHGYKI